MLPDSLPSPYLPLLPEQSSGVAGDTGEGTASVVGGAGPHPRHLNPQIQAHRVEGLGRLIQLLIWAWEVILDGLGGSTKWGIVQGGKGRSER